MREDELYLNAELVAFLINLKDFYINIKKRKENVVTLNDLKHIIDNMTTIIVKLQKTLR